MVRPGLKRRSRAAEFVWLYAAATLGFLVPFVAVGLNAVPRNLFVLVHLLVSGGLVAGYLRWSGRSVRELVEPVGAGVRGALVTGALMIAFVLIGPSSPAPAGPGLVAAVLWLGVAYATVDALLLSVLPVLVAWRIMDSRKGPQAAAGGPRVLLAGLGASLLVSATYHLGFPEFQGPRLLGALAGNAVLTLGFLATRSVLAPLGGHILLHVTAVLYGFDVAYPAPPHY